MHAAPEAPLDPMHQSRLPKRSLLGICWAGMAIVAPTQAGMVCECLRCVAGLDAERRVNSVRRPRGAKQYMGSCLGFGHAKLGRS